MQAAFWLEKWQKPEHGWTQKKVNSRLKRHWPDLGLEPSAQVLVPLCGDSIDLDWLIATGHRVCGCDLSPNAFSNWGQRHQLQMQESIASPTGNNNRHWEISGAWPPAKFLVTEAEQFAGDPDKQIAPQFISGDFLALEASEIPFAPQAVYDRAALVALSPDQRRQYAGKLEEILAPGGVVLLITMAYDQEKMKGPPFSVTDEEVDVLFSESFEIERVAVSSGPDILGNLSERGLDDMSESVFRLTRSG